MNNTATIEGKSLLEGKRKRRFRLILYRFGFVLVLFFLIGWLAWPFYRIGLNSTPSLPGFFILGNY